MIEMYVSLKIVVSDGQSTKVLGQFNFPASEDFVASYRQLVFTIPDVGHILNHDGLRFRVTSVEWSLTKEYDRVAKPTTLYVEPVY